MRRIGTPAVSRVWTRSLQGSIPHRLLACMPKFHSERDQIEPMTDPQLRPHLAVHKFIHNFFSTGLSCGLVYVSVQCTALYTKSVEALASSIINYSLIHNVFNFYHVYVANRMKVHQHCIVHSPILSFKLYHCNILQYK